MTRKPDSRHPSRLMAPCLLGVCLIWIMGAGIGTAQGAALRVVVSVPPQKTFVERIGGPHVTVRTMVQPGHNPHTYDPTPHQIADLSHADLYIRIGIPFERAWMKRICSANREMRILDARPETDPRDPSAPGHGRERPGAAAAEIDPPDYHHGQHGEHDPHIWTDPILVKRMADKIRAELIALDPDNAPDFERNYREFAAELEALDREIRALLDQASDRTLMVFHPSWDHFAAAYGLTFISIEKAGKEPGPRALTALIEQARRERVKVIFVQPQFSRKAAAQIARAIGGRVLAIDPLAADYIANLRRVARQIAAAVRE